MVTIEVILPRVQIPAANIFSIYTVEVVVTDIAAPIILGQEGAVWLLPCLILHVSRYSILGKSWQRSVPDICARIRKRDVIQTPERSELAESGQSVIDEVLVRSMETIVNDPVEVTFDSRKLDVDPVTALVEYRSREPLEIRSSPI